MSEKKYYLTKEKLKELKDEHENLVYLERLKTKNEAPKFLESEEVSSEFLTYQEDIGFIRARINELENIFKNYEIITSPPKNKKDRVNLGAKVKVKVDGEKDEFTIVGTIEANPSLGKISNESPVGKALMGHKKGDEVIISSPVKVTYKILKVKYPRHTS